MLAAQARPESSDAIVRLGTAYGASKALLSAVELGVFTELASGPRDCESLAHRLHLHPRGARDFFDTLVALGMLRRVRHRYLNTPATDHYLDRNKPSYMGASLEFANRQLYRDWNCLTSALQTGNPQQNADPATMAQLAAAPDADAAAAAALARGFPWADYRSVIEIGAAQATLLLQLAQVHPHLTGSAFGAEPPRAAIEAQLAEHQLGDRWRYHTGDLWADPFPGADVLVLGGVLRPWDLQQKRQLLRKACQSLTDEGALIVCEALIDDERKRNVTGLLLSLTLLLETPGGFEFTAAECLEWMKEAGLREMWAERLTATHSMVIGIK